MRFCGNCGRPLGDARASIDRRVVTILFADVIASTQLSGILDAERLREQIGGFFGIAREEIERFGGTIEKYIGDAVMAVFGLPSVHENDPERAVLAAWAILGRTRAYVGAGVIPDIRIGVSTGEVIADPRAAEKGEFMITGEVVILAARLQQHGGPGKILVDEPTRESTRHLFDYQRTVLQVKGKSDTVVAYVCGGPQEQQSSGRGIAGIGSPLVGREREFAALASRVEGVVAGQGGIVGIIGDAGLGKSRLVAEAGRAFAGRDMLWLEGRALSYSKSISFWPVMGLLRAAAGITVTDSETESWAKLEALVMSVLPDHAAEVIPYLGTLVGLEVPERWRERVIYLDGEAMGRQIHRSTRLLFERLARARPLVVVLEDLQWLDDSSVGLLEHLFPLVQQVPVLFCGLSRQDRAAPAARLRTLVKREYADRYTEITLEPLDPATSAVLIKNLLRTSQMPAPFVESVLRRAEGNPFFTEEIIRTLIHTGAIARDGDDRWLVRAGAGGVSLPGTLRGVIMARMDQLDESHRRLLRTASVIGRSFHDRVLREVAEDDQIGPKLTALAEMELIRERRAAPEREYVFKHALIQEAAYESILLGQRRSLHRKVGEAIERLFADRLEEFYGLLAHHFTQAEDWEKAQAYLFQAGDQSGKVAADAEALAHYQRALDAYLRSFGDTLDPLQRAGLDRKVAEALSRRGEHQQAMQHLQRGLAGLGRPLPIPRWTVRREIAKESVRQAGYRLLPGIFLARRPSESPAVAEERCRLYEAMAWVDYFVYVERVLLESLLALNLADRHRMPLWQASGSYGLGLVAQLLNLPRLAFFYLRRAESMLSHIRHPLVHGGVYLGLGFYELHATGRWAVALDHFRRSASRYREGGALRQWGASATMDAWVSRLSGHHRQSLDRAQELVRIGEDAGDPEVHGWGLAQLGATYWHLGRLDEAAAHLQRAVKLFRDADDDLWQTISGCDLARLYLQLGRIEEAEQLTREGEALTAKRGYLGYDRTHSRMASAEVWLAAAERAGQAGGMQALRTAEQACRLAVRQAEADCVIKPAAFRMWGSVQWLGGRRAAAHRWWQKAVAAAEALGARYELGLTYLEMGRRTGQVQPLQRAQSIFAELDAQWGASQAQRYLSQAG
ncbi:MAG TPA: AAA family ATPase [bacterium]|nr:AAA family ATPase [bacterium]